MDEFLMSLAAAARLAVVIGGSGAVFAFGVASISRWLKWAPVNINVHIHNYGEEPFDVVGRGKET